MNHRPWLVCFLTAAQKTRGATTTSSSSALRPFIIARTMTTRTTRSAANKKRDAGDSENAVDAAAVAPKKSKVKKKSTTQPIKASVSEQEEQPIVPWYHVFTKGDEEYNRYMATEWSYEKRGDRALFEKICLEGAQSGLSWQTILRKRDAYRRTFFQFDPNKVAQMTPDDVQQILDSTGATPRDTIVRHRGKIEATIQNAKCLLDMQKESGDADHALDKFLWSFVNDKPILNRTWGADFNPHGGYASLKGCPTKTAESEAMSKALKAKGWKFVGPTTCYALMQSSGMVIDHPMGTPEWEAARQRLLARSGGFQDSQPQL